MGLLQNPDPAIKLARQYGIRGIFTPEIVPSLQPVVLIDDLTGGISNEPQRICQASINITGVNAEKTIFRFETPPLVIAEIQAIYINPEASQIVDVFFGSFVAAPAAFTAGALTDGRLRSKGESPACRIGVDTYAASSSTIHGIFTVVAGVGSFNEVRPNWIIGRTDAFDFVELAGRTTDQNMTISIRWREFDAVAVR